MTTLKDMELRPKRLVTRGNTHLQAKYTGQGLLSAAEAEPEVLLIRSISMILASQGYDTAEPVSLVKFENLVQACEPLFCQSMASRRETNSPKIS
jgi:hypothetical protein